MHIPPISLKFHCGASLLVNKRMKDFFPDTIDSKFIVASQQWFVLWHCKWNIIEISFLVVAAVSINIDYTTALLSVIQYNH